LFPKRIFLKLGEALFIYFFNQQLFMIMVSQIKKAPAPPGVAVWILVTLLWGTVFYWTSIFMLQLASARLGQFFFNFPQSVLFNVYCIHVVFLIVIALAAMMVKKKLDPGALKQIQRKQAIAEGRGEKLFVSFAGSIATSFLFTVLTALTFFVSSRMLGFEISFNVPVVLLAALFNIAAGLAASMLVGTVFIIVKAVRKNA